MNRTGRPAHYLRHNKVTRVPRAFVYLDSEAHRQEVRSGELQTFRLAVAAYDARQHHRDGWKEREWFRTTDPTDLWAWVADHTSTKARTVLVAHNLAYDLRVCDAFNVLTSLGWELKWIRLDGATAQATWARDGRSLSMVDTLSWVPMPLDRLAGFVGMRKFQLPAWRDSDDAWFARCTRDVTILAEVWRRLMSFVRDDDLGNWKPTGAGQAWAAYRHRFMLDPILVHEDTDARAAERVAAWAGRAEVWQHGRARGGPFTEHDYSTAYACIGAECEVPTKLIGGTSAVTDSSWARLVARHRVLSECVVTTDVPTTPARVGARVAWPVGTFRTTLWENEIELARAHGATVTIERCWWYRRAPALKTFCEWCLSVVNAPDGAVDPVTRACVKHWSRSLVGRFGARWSSWDRYGTAPWSDVALGRALDVGADERFRLLQVGHAIYRQSELTDSPDAVPQVMSWVMAEARCRLWRAMTAAGLDHVIYVDTDAVIVNRDGHDALLEAALPGLRVKSRWSTVVAHGPRQIELQGELRAAGVPRRAVRVDPTHWQGEVWAQMSTSLAQGESDAVRITPRLFTVRGIDTRREHLPDGATAARVVELDGGELNVAG